ncbi:hypothetical protein HH310_33710 [Actinoplanes sp. TBRC 11911]|uniref:hypothetical protein n=1 Tax=Actinoplanes sp. TBRC 11911 TaxID=2729386 RepID=UPI00145E371F|nr:hypothetical protein [Actinoplanes sp. TBRC 11911]NMO56123.1 hypothetical protein [Actinoplanes sp. TBRC 11911]
MPTDAPARPLNRVGPTSLRPPRRVVRPSRATDQRQPGIMQVVRDPAAARQRVPPGRRVTRG